MPKSEQLPSGEPPPSTGQWTSLFAFCGLAHKAEEGKIEADRQKGDTCCQDKLGELQPRVEMTPEEGAKWETVMPEARLILDILSAQCEVVPEG